MPQEDNDCLQHNGPCTLPLLFPDPALSAAGLWNGACESGEAQRAPGRR